MATVHSLPVEILLDVFHEVSADIQHDYLANLQEPPSAPGNRYPYLWIKVTHVCRVWRAVALSSSTLWSTVVLTRSTATETFLRRAGSQLLTIILGVSYVFRLETLEERLSMLESLIEERVEQIGALTMPALPGYLTREFASRAKNLRMLTLQNPFLGDGDVQSAARHPFPALEHLSITAVPRTPITSLLVSTLKTLIILPEWGGFGDNTFDGPVALPSTKELLLALHDMPRLEKLHVEVDEEIVEADIVARLPKLKELRLDGSSTPAAYVFRHLEVPPNITFTFHRKLADIEPSEVIPVASIIRLSVTRPAQVGIDHTQFHPILSCAISWERDSGDYVIKGWRTLETREDTTSRERRENPVDVELHVITLEPLPVLKTFLAPFCFSSLQQLEIGPMPSVKALDAEECCKVLASGASLRSLTLSDFGALDILPGTTAKDIVLRNIAFKAGGSDIPGSVASLAGEFKSRMSHGFAVQQLSILDSSNVDSEAVTALEAVVGDVFWDGIVRIED